MTRDHAPDHIFLILIGIILIFGLVMLTSASAPLGYERYADSYYFLKHQIFNGLIPGLAALIFLAYFNYRRLKNYALPLLLISIGFLVLVFIPGLGVSYGGARSWLSLGPFSLQPSEIIKLTFLLFLATWLETRGSRIKEFSTGFLPFAVLLAVVGLLIVLQPDIGTLSIIILISLVVYFIGGGSIVHLIWITTGGLAMLAVLIQLAPYRTARFMTFLYPELDPQGIGYHINQALLAIGSGGFLGLGLGQSRQKFQYLPEVAGDSIFAVIAEELGFIFVIILVGLFLALMLRGFRIARNSPDVFGKLVAAGVTSWIIIQAFVNIGSMAGLVPMTGVTLPLISYGGTSLLVTLAALGILINISRQTRES